MNNERQVIETPVFNIQLPDLRHAALGELELAQVGTGNWDLYISASRSLYAIAKPGSGAQDSFFGNGRHICKLLANDDTAAGFTTGWTEAGREYLAGIQTVIVSRRVCFAN